MFDRVKLHFQQRQRFKNFIKQIQKRTERQWQDAWIGYNIDSVKRVCKQIETDMGSSHQLLFPEDGLDLVFFNLTGDMREVVAIFNLSQLVGCDLENYSELTVGDLIQRDCLNGKGISGA